MLPIKTAYCDNRITTFVFVTSVVDVVDVNIYMETRTVCIHSFLQECI